VESGAAEEFEHQGAGNSIDKTEMLKQEGLTYSWRHKQAKFKEEKQNGCPLW